MQEDFPSSMPLEYATRERQSKDTVKVVLHAQAIFPTEAGEVPESKRTGIVGKNSLFYLFWSSQGAFSGLVSDRRIGIL